MDILSSRGIRRAATCNLVRGSSSGTKVQCRPSEIISKDLQDWGNPYFLINRVVGEELSRLFWVFGRLAQLVEQLTLNQRVVGSNPTSPTKFS